MNTHRLITGLLLASSLVTLSGCFPLVATGFGSGVLVAADRRSSGSYVEDEGIEWKVLNTANQKYGSQIHLNVTSYNRSVLLTGEVANEQIRQAIGNLASQTANVKTVHNELVVGPTSSLGNRSTDTFTTSKVKTRFVDGKAGFNANQVKVVTEGGTVFLLGLVTEREGQAATEIARTTAGVQRVVRLFEYITPEQARQLDARPPEKDRSPSRYEGEAYKG